MHRTRARKVRKSCCVDLHYSVDTRSSNIQVLLMYQLTRYCSIARFQYSVTQTLDMVVIFVLLSATYEFEEQN